MGDGWRKSSYSNGSGGNNCVEVGTALDLGSRDVTVRVRDSKLGEGSPVLEFTSAEWRAFLAGVRAGEFDLGGQSG